MTLTGEFWILLAAGVVLYSGLIAVAVKIGPRWMDQRYSERYSEREEFLISLVAQSKKTFTDLQAEITVYKDALRAKDAENGNLKLESSKRDEKIAALTAKVQQMEETIARLTRELEQYGMTEKTDKGAQSMSILAIWPTAPGQASLDTAGEADALYNSGYLYTALRGNQANRVGVVLEIDRVRPTIIQMGGHGTAEGIWLSDGIAEPGWWGEAVAGKNIELMVLLSCHSSQQDEINISDALIRVGVRAVISCDDAIADGAAVRFAELLYAKMSEGLSLPLAVRRAKLGVSR